MGLLGGRPEAVNFVAGQFHQLLMDAHVFLLYSGLTGGHLRCLYGGVALPGIVATGSLLARSKTTPQPSVAPLVSWQLLIAAIAPGPTATLAAALVSTM